MEYPELTRDTIDMRNFESLKTMDGCGPELNAMIELINGDLDVLENGCSDSDDSDGNNEAIDLAEYNEIDEIANVEEVLHEKMCRDLPKILPDGYRCMKHLSSGTMMKQAHDGAKCNANNSLFQNFYI